MARTLSLIVRNLAFTVMVPGLGGAWVPWWILTRHGRTATPDRVGSHPCHRRRGGPVRVVYLELAAVGRGTPGPWDAPSRVVAAGPTAGCATRSTWPRS